MITKISAKNPLNSESAESYYFEYQKIPEEKDAMILFEGINDEAVERGMQRMQPFGIYIKDEEERNVGGVYGYFIYGGVHIDLLWLSKELRHQGWGLKLMLETEAIARERKCKFATVNTMDWEALTFYQKLGYQIEFTREGYEKQSKMYFLRKKINDTQ